MDDSDPKPEPIVRRRQAQSGIDYADEVVLHKTRDSLIVFRPWYIPHATRPPRLAGRLEKWRMAKSLRRGVAAEVELPLDEDATAALLDALQRHTAVASGTGTGEYAVLRLGKDVARDPAALAQAFAAVLENSEVLDRLADEELAPTLVSGLRASLRIRELRLAVDSLRKMLDGGTTDEQSYQRWCEQHSWAFGLGYVDRDDFRRISAGDDLDLLLPRIESGYRDVAELKRPNHPVMRYDESHKSFYWSPETSSAIGQVSRYLDVLHEDARKGLRDHPEVVAWHPRAVIVIGRTVGWTDDAHRALWGLNSRLHAIEVSTYDHLLARGERLLEILHKPT